jgi:MFS family permease
MIIFVYMPYLWIVLPLDMVSTWLRGVGAAAATNLGLEQVPQARGTYTSLSGMFGSLGAIIGIIIGGTVLDQFTVGAILNPNGFLFLIPIFGAFGVASVVVNYIFVKDPCKK